MSSTGAECVSAPTEMRSAPAFANSGRCLDGHASRHLDEDPLRCSADRDDAHAVRHLFLVHVVEHHDRGTGIGGLLHLVGTVALDLDHPPRPRPACQVDSLCDAEPARWLSLIITASDRFPR